MITIELEIEGHYVDNFIEEILTIDGILDATVSFGSVLQVATYQMKFDSNSLEILDVIKSHNTQVINIEADRLLILHIASEKDIRLLYNKLDNASLLGFCQMPLAVGQPSTLREQ
ncbi:hypothetical protein SAMN05660841_01667 [Sphingobacterium nematocida]|uniref:Uncharacterized protein n=2 Tax=Sphingobacterium nematocida TaxID=1513896 RepID=A0A1T5CYL1_9SPHI|nr:hypothetical protein SAMN05660841_01667 [Sphingobacterium nematocida]